MTVLVAAAVFAAGVIVGMVIITELLFPSKFWKIFTSHPKGK